MNLSMWEIAGLVFVISEWIIRLAVLPIIPYRRSPVAAKSWLLLIFFEPWIGLALYILVGGLRLPSWRRKRLAKLSKALESLQPRFQGYGHVTHPEPSHSLEQAVKLAEELGQFPILAGNEVELLADYQESIDRLVFDIDNAKHHVHLLYYIFADDRTTQSVVQALGRAVSRSVACRVLVDAIGSRPWLKTLLPKLIDLGVQVETALPLNPLRRAISRPDLRNHRKIAVLDGRIGYTGSQNIVASQTTAGLPFQELVARITGPAVWQLQLVFATDWYVESGELLEENSFPEPIISGSVAVQAVPSGPGFPRGNNQKLMVSLVHGAISRVVITTPYFIPDESFLGALEIAVLRGVDVHLIVSEKSDQWMVDLAQRSYYQQLLEAGVHIHLTQGKFLHAKHISVDNALVVIGSSNVDIRSFHLNEEISLLIYDAHIAHQLDSYEKGYVHSATTLTLEAWQKRGIFSDFLQHIARLFSPLL